MKNKLKFNLILIFLFFFKINIDALMWESVPIKSMNQKKAGLKGGEGMQMIQFIAYAPSNPNIVYMVSDTSQVWKSTDGGKTWVMKHNGFYANGGLSIGVDPDNENIVFVAGTIGYPIDRYQPTDPLNGIFRSIDGGETWKLVKKAEYFKRADGDNGGTYFAFSNNSINKLQSKTIYAGTYSSGLLKSIDGGETWSVCGLKGINIYDIKVNMKNQSIIYISSTQGFYKYDDMKNEIKKIGEGLPDYTRTIAIDFQDPNNIYAAVGKYGVFFSGDGGLNFIEKNNGLPINNNFLNFLDKKEFTHISLSPVNPKYLYVSINLNREHKPNPFYSHDGGNTWYSPKTIDQDNLSFYAGDQKFFSAHIEPHPKDPNVAFTAANGKARVLKTVNGGESWFYSGEGYTGGRMGGGKASLAFFSNPKKMIFFLIDFGPALTMDGGDTFRMLPIVKTFSHFTSVSCGASSWDENSNTIVSAVGRWDKQLLEVSKDNGNSWEIIDDSEDSYRFISFHPQNPNVIYAQGLISEDAGRTWQKLSKKIFAVYKGNGDIVYSVEETWNKKSVIVRSNNRGKTWEITYPEMPIPMKVINELDIDPTNPDKLYVATNLGIGIYDKKWIKKSDESGLNKDYFGLTSVKCISVDPKHPEKIYIGRWSPGKGQSNGVFMSDDYGKSWKNISYNLGQEMTIWSIAVSPHNGTVFIGSSHGTWKLIW